MATGIELIAAERERQVTQEGWTPEQDDAYHDDVLARAGATYALPERLRELHPGGIKLRESLWPFIRAWWKPTPNDRVRELVKAGALIAAEIDRLQRAEAANEPAKRLLPLDCIECGASTGPLWPEDGDHAGWMCPACKKRLGIDQDDEG